MNVDNDKNIILINHSRFLTSGYLSIDLRKKLIKVCKRNIFFSKSIKVYSFNEMDRLEFDTHDDGDSGYYFTLLLFKKFGELVWYHKVKSKSKFEELNHIICKSIGIGNYTDFSVEDSVECFSCKRIISKVSTRCLYCGEPKKS